MLHSIDEVSFQYIGAQSSHMHHRGRTGLVRIIKIILKKHKVELCTIFFEPQKYLFDLFRVSVKFEVEVPKRKAAYRRLTSEKAPAKSKGDCLS